ncbi:sensor histidine kinase [Flavobacterium caeni]|uniref:Histidine kinase-, DNA gyrase B-, and HSP90-like ATPase n=1 Tax=Flavobacterium caeni TaxID=490189 RepID=A0A1G5KAP0_9FLAO|nr:ATP-binding protein [Flavobacterium caeni]SCY97019.1 hypothetical protein SAMN02927903_03174 [Flavobacterium caeni]
MKQYLILVLFLVVGIAHGQTDAHLSIAEAEQQYREAKVNEDPPTVAWMATQAGELHLQSKNFKRAHDYFLVAKEIYQKKKDSVQLGKVSCLLAQHYLETGNVKRYRDYVTLAEQLMGKKKHLPEYLLLLDTQIAYYQSRGKAKQVQYLSDLKAGLQQPAAPTSAVAAKPAAPISVTTAKAPETASAEESELPVVATSTINLDQLAMILAIAIAAISFIGLIYFSYRDRRRSIEQAKNLETMQARMIENLSRAVDSIESGRELSSLSKQLADISLVKTGQKRADFELEPIGPFVQSVVASFLARAEQTKRNVVSNLEQSRVKQLLDKKTVQTIFDLIGTEALAQTPADGKIYLSATVEKSKLRFRVSYPHEPLDKEVLDKLFENLEDTQAQRRNPVGFALLGTLVDWYGGAVDASHDGQLLKISVELPLSEPKRKTRQMAALW